MGEGGILRQRPLHGGLYSYHDVSHLSKGRLWARRLGAYKGHARMQGSSRGITKVKGHVSLEDIN